MQYNFNPQGHFAYTRVSEIRIRYGADRIPVINFTIQQAMVDGADKVRHTDRDPIGKGPVSALQLPASVPAVNEATGEHIPGQEVTLASLQLGLSSYTRWVLDQENKPVDGALTDEGTNPATE